jgi:hypothetical protein
MFHTNIFPLPTGLRELYCGILEESISGALRVCASQHLITCILYIYSNIYILLAELENQQIK